MVLFFFSFLSRERAFLPPSPPIKIQEDEMLLLLLLLLLLRLTHFLRAYVRTRNLLEMGKEKLERVELLACLVFFFFFCWAGWGKKRWLFV